MFKTNNCPGFGYILKNWGQTGYRATALAYLKREGLFEVEHINGRFYTLTEIERDIIKPEKKIKKYLEL